MNNSYAVSRTDDGMIALSVNGYFSNLTEQALSDCLTIMGIDLLSHINMVVTRWPAGNNQEILVHITRTLNQDSASHTIEIVKK